MRWRVIAHVPGCATVDERRARLAGATRASTHARPAAAALDLVASVAHKAAVANRAAVAHAGATLAPKAAPEALCEAVRRGGGLTQARARR